MDDPLVYVSWTVHWNEDRIQNSRKDVSAAGSLRGCEGMWIGKADGLERPHSHVVVVRWTWPKVLVWLHARITKKLALRRLQRPKLELGVPLTKSTVRTKAVTPHLPLSKEKKHQQDRLRLSFLMGLAISFVHVSTIVVGFSCVFQPLDWYQDYPSDLQVCHFLCDTDFTDLSLGLLATCSLPLLFLNSAFLINGKEECVHLNVGWGKGRGEESYWQSGAEPRGRWAGPGLGFP